MDITAAITEAEMKANRSNRVWFVIHEGGEYRALAANNYIPREHRGFWKPTIERVVYPPRWTYRRTR